MSARRVDAWDGQHHRVLGTAVVIVGAAKPNSIFDEGPGNARVSWYERAALASQSPRALHGIY